jgi:phage gpG-like protein
MAVPVGYHRVSPHEMAELLNRRAQQQPEVRHALLDHAALIIQKEAKRVIGTYEYGWPQLQLATQIARENKGFAPNDPLLMTGELRDSIQYSSDEHEARVGTNNPKGVWMELGTRRGIPPRSFLMGAAMHKEKEVVALVGKGVHISLTSDQFELLDITGMVDKAVAAAGGGGSDG